VPAGVRTGLRIFHSTAPIVRWLLSFRSGVEPQLRRGVERELLGMHEDPAGLRALAQARNIVRFDRVTAGDRAEIERWRSRAAQLPLQP
jgi:hypothetical protein